ncbi:MAG: diacylglycerol kinase, partial [Desulforhopalus sp.]
MDRSTAKTGLARIVAAFFYSLHGLRYAISSEAAFRQEVLIFLVLLIALLFLPVSTFLKLLLLLANTVVLVAELINSAVEAIVDLVSPDYHLLAKHAKDLGSAAV